MVRRAALRAAPPRPRRGRVSPDLRAPQGSTSAGSAPLRPLREISVNAARFSSRAGAFPRSIRWRLR